MSHNPEAEWPNQPLSTTTHNEPGCPKINSIKNGREQKTHYLHLKIEKLTRTLEENELAVKRLMEKDKQRLENLLEIANATRIPRFLSPTLNNVQLDIERWISEISAEICPTEATIEPITTSKIQDERICQPTPLLMRTADRNQNEDPPLPKSMAKIAVSLKYPNNSLGTDVTFHLKITNEGTTAILKGSYVMLEKTEYFKEVCIVVLTKTIMSGESFVTDFTVQVDQSMVRASKKPTLALHLPSAIGIRLFSENYIQIDSHQTGFYLDIRHFTKDIFCWKPLDANTTTANILLFGPKGLGKSSFVNSLYAALYDEMASDCAVTGNFNRPATTSFQKFPFNNVFNLFDCPGMENSRQAYQGEEVELMLEGILPVNTELLDRKIFYSHYMHRRHSAAVAWKQRIHVVLFFVSVDLISPGGDESDLRVYVDAYHKFTRELGRKVLIVISKADLINANDGRINRLVNYFQIPLDEIFYLSNCPEKTTKMDAFARDKSALSIALGALEAANDFMRLELRGEVSHLYDREPQSVTLCPKRYHETSEEPAFVHQDQASSTLTSLQTNAWALIDELQRDGEISNEQISILKRSNPSFLSKVFMKSLKGEFREDIKRKFLIRIRVFTEKDEGQLDFANTIRWILAAVCLAILIQNLTLI